MTDAKLTNPTARHSGVLRSVHFRTGLSVGIALLASSSLVIGTLLQPHASAQFPPPPTGWTTFDVAQEAVQAVVAPPITGPWSLEFAEGAAANGPWAPMAWQWGIVPESLCGLGQQTLSGISTLTFWNASEYPSSDSPAAFTSGGAPLWTFVFENASGFRIAASWFSGQVILNGLVRANSTCPISLSSSPILPNVEMDSSAAAQVAIDEAGATFASDAAYHSALYFPGRTLLPFSMGVGGNIRPWQMVYSQCGMPTYHGSSRITDYIFNSTTGERYGPGWTTITCYDTSYLLTLDSSKLQNSTSPPGAQVWTNLTAVSVFTSAVPATARTTDLTTALFDPDITILSYPWDLRPAAAACNVTNPYFASCTPPSKGWYAVLLDTKGQWLDSFPSTAGGMNWTLAGVPVVVGDQLVFVFAPGPIVNANLELRGTLSNPWVWANVQGGAIYF